MKYQQYYVPRIITCLALLLLIAGCKEMITDTTNHFPVINSFTVSPNQVQLADSFSVVCSAIDSDGDLLMYNWGSQSFLSIKGAPPLTPYVYNNSNNDTVVIYTPDSVSVMIDSITISCGVIDGKGGWASTSIRVAIKR